MSRKKKAKDIQRTEEKLQKTVKQKAVVQENVLPEIRNIKEKVTAQESATQEFHHKGRNLLRLICLQ